MSSITHDLFERWKAAKGHASDRQGCLALGLSHGAAVFWKRGQNGTADVIEKMARDLGADDYQIIALLMQAAAETQKPNSQAAQTLNRLAKVVDGWRATSDARPQRS